MAAIQLCSSDEVRENIESASRLIRLASHEQPHLIATPEMTSLIDRKPGALLAKSKVEKDDEALAAFQALAAKLHVWLLIGSLPIRVSQEKCVNRSYLISPQGKIASRYDKIHLFDVDFGNGETYCESNDYIPGDKAVLANLLHVRLGMTICYDLRFPHLYRAMAKAGAEILMVPAAFTRITGEAHWHSLLRARAIETGCFVIAPAQGGIHVGGCETFGHSLIVGPWGQVLAEGGIDPGVIHATLDLDQVAEARRKIPAMKHDRQFVLSEAGGNDSQGVRD
ncbi:MAG: carbon-nitrogen hydrolase family protein [Nitrospirota bacterium]